MVHKHASSLLGPRAPFRPSHEGGALGALCSTAATTAAAAAAAAAGSAAAAASQQKFLLRQQQANTEAFHLPRRLPVWRQSHLQQQALQQQQQQQQRGFSFVQPHCVRRALPVSAAAIGSLSPSALCCLLRAAAAKGLKSGAFWREAERRLLFLANSLSPAAAAAAAAALATARRSNPLLLQRLELRAIETKN
ncbi:hypothetical protein, conserved, partial [Eimeria tenella]